MNGGSLSGGSSLGHALDEHGVSLLDEVLLAVEVDEVPGARRFGLQIEAVVLVGRYDVWDASRDMNPVLLELADLVRVVRHQAYRADIQAGEHVRGDGVVALVVAKPERDVGVHRVEAPVLQRVGAHLVDEPDAAPFLPEIEEQAPRHRCEPAQRDFELIAAIAAQGPRHVPGQALGVQPRGNIVGAHDVSVHHGDVLLAIAVVPERDDPESPEPARQLGHRLDSYANPRPPAEAAAIVVLVAFDQIAERGDALHSVTGRIVCHDKEKVTLDTVTRMAQLPVQPQQPAPRYKLRGSAAA